MAEHRPSKLLRDLIELVIMMKKKTEEKKNDDLENKKKNMMESETTTAPTTRIKTRPLLQHAITRTNTGRPLSLLE